MCTVETGEMCGICYEQICQDKIIKMPCLHSTCIDCFKRINGTVCPFCRNNFLSKREILDSYFSIYPLRDNENDPNIINNFSEIPTPTNEFSVETERHIFMLESRQEQRENQLLRRYRNKLRRKLRRTNHHSDNEFFDFYVLFENPQTTINNSKPRTKRPTTATNKRHSQWTNRYQRNIRQTQCIRV